MKKPGFAIATMGLAAALVLSACGRDGDSTKAGDDFVVGVTTLFPTGTLAEFTAELDRLAADADMTFTVQDVSNDAAKENKILSAFATKKVDLVMASVVSPTGSLAALNRLSTAKVPVICFNTCLAPPDDEKLTKAFVTNDQKALGDTTGKAAAEYIRSELGGKAKVAFLTCETYDVCKQRRDGLDEALSSVETTTVAEQEGFVVDKATPIATAILTADPDVDVFIAENEDAVVAAAKAIKTRGLTGKVVVFGIGINPTVAQLLLNKDKTVRQVTGQAAEEWAREAVRVAGLIRDGKSVGDYNHFTPGPAYSYDEPEPIQAYLDSH